MEFKINVQNVHMAEIDETDGEIVFGKPEHIAGAMEIGREPQISDGKLWGDGKIRHATSRKNSYQINVHQNKLPTKWRRYMEGVNVENGVESGTSKDEPRAFAIGWEVEKTGGKKELIWFLYCKAEPIKESTQQSEDNINYSTDNIVITATEHDLLKRFYTFIDTETDEFEDKDIENFFSQVQTGDGIESGNQEVEE